MPSDVTNNAIFWCWYFGETWYYGEFLTQILFTVYKENWNRLTSLEIMQKYAKGWRYLSANFHRLCCFVIPQSNKNSFIDSLRKSRTGEIKRQFLKELRYARFLFSSNILLTTFTSYRPWDQATNLSFEFQLDRKSLSRFFRYLSVSTLRINSTVSL